MAIRPTPLLNYINSYGNAESIYAYNNSNIGDGSCRIGLYCGRDWWIPAALGRPGLPSNAYATCLMLGSMPVRRVIPAICMHYCLSTSSPYCDSFTFCMDIARMDFCASMVNRINLYAITGWWSHYLGQMASCGTCAALNACWFANAAPTCFCIRAEVLNASGTVIGTYHTSCFNASAWTSRTLEISCPSHWGTPS